MKLTAENTILKTRLVVANNLLKSAGHREIQLSAEIRDLKSQLAVANNSIYSQPTNRTPVQIPDSQPAPDINLVSQPLNLSTGKNAQSEQNREVSLQLSFIN